MRKTITQEHYLQLVGLLALADYHNRALKDITQAALEITDERDDGEIAMWGHTADAVYGESDVKELLRRLDITVAPRATTPEEIEQQMHQARAIADRLTQLGSEESRE